VAKVMLFFDIQTKHDIFFVFGNTFLECLA